MNIIKKIAAALAALGLFIGFALPAVAQASLYGSASVSANANASTTAGAGASGNTNASGSGNLGADLNAIVHGMVGGSLNSSTTESGNGSGGANAETSGNAGASGSSGATLDVTPLLITRFDIDTNAVRATSMLAAQVTTKADLEGFIAAQMQSDKDVAAVEASSASVFVTHAQGARLFGFIPITVNATATVDANGNVDVSFPWWAFLAATNKGELQAKLQQRVNAEFGANASANGALHANAGKVGVVSGNASATGTAAANANANANATANAAAKLTARQQAKLIAEMKAVMQDELKANANAAASAAAKANGNVNVQ